MYTTGSEATTTVLHLCCLGMTPRSRSFAAAVSNYISFQIPRNLNSYYNFVF